MLKKFLPSLNITSIQIIMVVRETARGDRFKTKKDKPLTHDNISHTLLGLMNIDTKVYQKNLDLTAR